MAQVVMVAAMVYMGYMAHEQQQAQKKAMKEQKKAAAEARRQFEEQKELAATERQEAIDAAKAAQEAEVSRRRGGMQNVFTSPLGVTGDTASQAGTTLGV